MSQPGSPAHMDARGAIPFFPGNQFSDPYRQNFAVSHVFDRVNGINTVDDDKTPLGLERTISTAGAANRVYAELSATADRISRETGGRMSAGLEGTIPSQTMSSSRSSIVRPGVDSDEMFIPNHLKFFHVVLRFYAYFVQTIFESPGESTRIRFVEIMNYLEDNTWSINEPEQKNSGLPQGGFLRRQAIPELNVDDFLIGGVVQIFGREFHIYGMDASTRSFLAESGRTYPENMMPPKDTYTETRGIIDNHTGTMHVTRFVPDDPLAKFLTFKGKVLRFYGVWNSRTGTIIEKRHLVVHYFLEDDTVEVLEEQPQNSGRDPFPKFLRRQRLPKFGDSGPKALGPIGAVPSEREYVKAKDLRVGVNLVVYGRTVELLGCDKFTADFLTREMGATPAETVISPVFATGKNQLPPDTTRVPTVRPPIPPYEGFRFGTEEDSIGSCFALQPKPPRKDMVRLNKYAHVVLRFGAKLVGNADGSKPCHPTMEPRKFVVTYFLADDTISIFETTPGCTLMTGGKFLERSRVKNVRTGEYFKPEDFVIGVVIEVFSHFFRLVEMDERTKKVMDRLAKGEDLVDLSLDNVAPKPVDRAAGWVTDFAKVENAERQEASGRRPPV